jgi:hypothetical protein
MNRRRFLESLAAASALAPGDAAAAPADLRSDARTAWLYVLPLIEMAVARARILQRRGDGHAPPSNSLIHAPHLAGPASRAITTPNCDTIYSTAFVDVSAGPVGLGVPAAGSRYFSLAILDMYTDANVVLGARTPGGAAGDYRLIGPGTSKRDARDLELATPHAWLLARILVDGDGDLPAARRLQGALALAGPPLLPPPVYATRASDWSAYFRFAADLIESDPPRFAAGRAAFARLRGACRSGDFARAGYAEADALAIDDGVADARSLVQGAVRQQAFSDGWSYPRPNLGNFGDDIAYRAAVAVGGLGALPREEAMYMRAAGDGGDGLFRGDGLYRLRLPAAPPVDGFWSLTMYEATADGQFFLTPNVLARYAIGDRTRGLRRDVDGALDLWIGRGDPGGERRANWLPAPASGPFALVLRAYLPQRPLLDGSYRLPPAPPAAG